MTQNYDVIAPFYDIDMGRNQRFDDVGFLRACVLSHPGSVLELGCGNGRVLQQLLVTQQALVGLDTSRAMLLEARKRLPDTVALVQGDMRAIPLSQCFSWVLLPYSLATYLVTDADWHSFSNSLRQVTGPGSRVVLDCFIPQDQVADGLWHTDYDRAWRDGRLHRTKRITAIGDGCNRIERHYQYLPGTNALEAFVVSTCETIRPYRVAEMQARLATIGLRPQAPIFDYAMHTGPSQAQVYCLIAVV
jgi:SAM-dependent methyltransferase